MPSHASIHLENVWHGLNGVTLTCHGINHNCGLDISLKKGNVLVPCYVFCSCSWQKGLNVPLGSKGSYLVLYYCLFMNEHEIFHTYLQHLFITSQHFILLYIFRGLHYIISLDSSQWILVCLMWYIILSCCTNWGQVMGASDVGSLDLMINLELRFFVVIPFFSNKNDQCSSFFSSLHEEIRA